MHKYCGVFDFNGNDRCEKVSEFQTKCQDNVKNIAKSNLKPRRRKVMKVQKKVLWWNIPFCN